MNEIPRDVILDLLPLHLAGEASPASTALVEAYLAEHPDLARETRAAGLADRRESLPDLPPDLGMVTLRRTRGWLRTQRRLYALAWALTVISFSLVIHIDHGRVTDVHLLVRDLPVPLGSCMLLAAAAWVAYALVGRRLRGAAGTADSVS
jgi:hypothetical protein